MAFLPEWMVKTAYKWAPRHMRALGQYAKAGVKLTLGTDAGSPLNGFNDTALEAQLMVMAVQHRPKSYKRLQLMVLNYYILNPNMGT